jgi:hypothetical protein
MTHTELKEQYKYHLEMAEGYRMQLNSLGYISDFDVMAIRLKNAIFSVFYIEIDRTITSRMLDHVKPRFLYYYYMRKHSKKSLNAISLGGQDHSTVIHALQEFENLYLYDKEYKQNCDEVFKIMAKHYNLEKKDYMTTSPQVELLLDAK